MPYIFYDYFPMMSLKISFKNNNILMPKKLTLFFAPILSISMLASCGDNKSRAANGKGEKVLDYKVLTLQPRPATLNVDYPASIQGQQNIEIRPKVDGYVEKIFVD